MNKIFRKLIKNVHILRQVLEIRHRYRCHVARLRKMGDNEKIKVLFIVSDVAKWKEQALYEAMDQSGLFLPIVGISAWNGQSEEMCSNERLVGVLQETEDFFCRLGNRCVRTVRIEGSGRVYSDLSEFTPDVVYYTEPWLPPAIQSPEKVSRFALTCYSPYYVPNYSSIKEECKLPLHRFLWNFYCLGSWQGKYFDKKGWPLKWFRATVEFVGVGHPALDFFQIGETPKQGPCTIIYAPHFSIKGDVPWIHHYATFRWSGMFMLEYAKNHPEINWVFKPHPLLKVGIKRAGLMSDEEIEGYYAQWREIAIACEDSDYQRLFLDSAAMITDCGSFLSEYGATRRPIIHLISSDNELRPISLLADLYDTYYKAHNLDELKLMLTMVVEKGEDPMRERRLRVLEKTGLTGSCASKNIIAHLLSVFGKKKFSMLECFTSD